MHELISLICFTIFWTGMIYYMTNDYKTSNKISEQSNRAKA